MNSTTTSMGIESKLFFKSGMVESQPETLQGLSDPWHNIDTKDEEWKLKNLLKRYLC